MRPPTSSSSKNSRRSERFDLVVRDGKTGFVFFNIEGNLYEYDAAARLLTLKGGRLLISQELANSLGRVADAGAAVGQISIAATMYPIEVTTRRQRRSPISRPAPKKRGAARHVCAGP